MIEKQHWKAYSGKKQVEIINDLKEVILNSGGYIVNFSIFSDLALSLNVEIEENQIAGLFKALNSLLVVEGFHADQINADSNQEWLMLLHISFGKGKGKLKTEIPMVPG